MATYTIHDPTDITGVRFIITDALTGIQYAVTRDAKIPLDVPLCEGCDSEVDRTGFCDSCDEPVIHDQRTPEQWMKDMQAAHDVVVMSDSFGHPINSLAARRASAGLDEGKSFYIAAEQFR